MPPECFVEPSRVAVAAKVHGGLDGAAGFDEGERVFQPQAAQASGDLPAPLVGALEEGEPVVTGDRVTAADFLGSIPAPETTAGVLDEIAERLDADAEGERASALELALEGLYLARRIGKEADETGQTLYG